MLWQPSIAAQRLMPRGGIAMTLAVRPGYLIRVIQHNHDRGRWRS